VSEDVVLVVEVCTKVSILDSFLGKGFLTVGVVLVVGVVVGVVLVVDVVLGVVELVVGGGVELDEVVEDVTVMNPQG